MKQLLMSLTLFALGTFSQVAFAGEWNPGQGEVPAKQHANSECLFNGLDELDAVFGGGEPNGPGNRPDDLLWSQTPAGANGNTRVQSYGQLVAFGLKAFVASPEVACNDHLNPYNP